MLARTRTRKIVQIDEEKCNGCGECVPSCAEGAIQIINGKARLVGEKFCDGLGNCLGACPQDAITIEERPAEDYDESAVHVHLAKLRAPQPPAHHGGCPGAALRTLNVLSQPPASPAGASARPGPVPQGQGGQQGPQAESKLRQWPIQLTLLPEQGLIWQDADVLLAADCVAFAMADFHERFVGGRTVAIACPKLDDGQSYVDKLARIFASNTIRSITIAHMEVPCCFGLERIARAALAQAGKDLPITTIKVAIRGGVLAITGPDSHG